MDGDDTLANALADVRQRRAELQADYERITAEMTKLRLAEKSLAAIVEGADAGGLDAEAADPVRSRGGGRGSRGPRANSAKGRLKALIEGAGPQGLSQAEIAQRLPDVAPATLNTYLSVMLTGGEAVRRGDFYAPGAADAGDEPDDASPEEDGPAGA